MIKLRKIEKKDIEVVFDHVCLLAKHEGEISPDFVLTKAQLSSELFSSQSDWYGLVATKENKIIGSCLYTFANTNRPFNKTGCLFLDVLFVEQNYRNQGVGKLFMNKLLLIAKDRKLKRIEFWCMKNKPLANKFYVEFGAKKISDLNVYSLNFE